MESGFDLAPLRRGKRAAARAPGDEPPGEPPAGRADYTRPGSPQRRTEEWRSFVFFTVVMAPLLAVIGVSGYGFLVWMFQTFVTGPPH